ncbi:hypothetical protein ANTQUA_LOCUS8023 [Anthophora quadrimaculata]
MFFWFFAFSALQFCVVQADFDVMFEDVECTEFNPEYVETCITELNYDSTYGASLDTHINIIKEFPINTKIIADVFTVQMGEYTVSIGLHVDADFCGVVETPNSLAIPMLRAINMDTNMCPAQPGIYEREGFVLDNLDGLPSSFPPGHYLLNMSLVDEKSVLLHIDAYIRIY